MDYRWTYRPKPNSQIVQSIKNQLGIRETLAYLLAQRGICSFEEAKHFFRPSLVDLHSPFLMKDMDKAVLRIESALQKGDRIMIYGDYDVDGTTSVALVSSYLNTFSENIVTYIPDRYTEGYGISYQGIDFAYDNEIKLIIALDCGIKAIEKVHYANNKKIDFIICDHHRPGTELPNAIAVLNPKRTDCKYPYKELCGCGVGFKLIQALEKQQGRGLEHIQQYLDLVAIAISADIVPITGENRILVYYGLQKINSNPSVGVKALLAHRTATEKTVSDLVFGIAPKINAAGRMKHGIFAVNILKEKNEELARFQAEAIDLFNTQRKYLDEEITRQALLQIEENNETENYTSVVFNPNWHKGVIGIVASRVMETYYRPTLVFTKSGDKLAASARSVRNFDIYEALEACKEHIEQFGGHKYAAGLTLLPEKYLAFKKAFERVVSETISKKDLIPEILIDTKIDLSQINKNFFEIIKQFGPFGPENANPTFLTCGIKKANYAKFIGKTQEHIRFSILITDHKNRMISIPCIGFGLADKLDIIKSKEGFDMVYHIEENHWQGDTSLQLRVLDIRKSVD